MASADPGSFTYHFAHHNCQLPIFLSKPRHLVLAAMFINRCASDAFTPCSAACLALSST